MLPPIDLRTLHFFLRVLEMQSFSEVARQENVATSMVSRAIQQLEDQLKQPLFYRNTRAVTPTEAGLLFAEDARLMVEQFTQAQRKLNERSQVPSGLIRLNAPVVFGRRHIAPHLPALAEKYPQLQVNLMLTDDYIDPHSEPTDIIFRISQLTDSTLHAKVIAQQRHYIAASPDYLAKYGTPQTPEDLLRHRCILYRNNLGTQRWLFKAPNSEWKQYSVPAVLTTNNGETIYTSCKQGLGLCLLPDWAVYEGLQSGELVKVLERYHAAVHTEERTIAMLYPNMRHNSLNVRAVIDFFSEVLEEGGYWQC